MKKIILYSILGVLAISLGWLTVDLSPSMRSFIKLRVIEQGPNITYYLGNGGNSGLIIGANEAVLIDTKFGSFSKKLHKSVIKKIGAKKLTIINTHYHTDHTGGNALYDGSAILSGNYGESSWLLENDVNTLPSQWIKTDTTLDLGGISIEIIPVGANHTKQDLFVYIPEENVLFTGDVYSHQTHPVIKEGSEPNIENWENTLKKFANSDRSIEQVVPGHGDLATKTDLYTAAAYFADLNLLSKKAFKRKYKRWYKLPFMATSEKNWIYIQNHNVKNP
ncbi:MBL fold metallo-hydrolase [Portibacter lacus]|uniref:Metallo-beta-lactamase domain-containing protein n=1 Tax=Portibacter lacus TaxID=1099794 RepID=A0AA37SSV7_9BACT|nr:MBL fold metallo-hydrolase [Portibacter lacus]GLR19447.1 hypothetical protein GCM10007940_40630 [Portibacter lacus]